MIRSKILQLTVATALIAGAQSALACSTAAWLGGATATAGEPTTAQFRRYSGRCSISPAAVGNTVIDTSPNAEVAMKARFYAFTGDLTGETDIYQAKNTGGSNVIRVTYDGTQFRIYSNGGTAQTVAAAANKYYGIEVRWAAATGSTTAIVRGNNGAATTVTATGPTGNSVDSAVLGWISGGTLGAGGAQPNFDDYDSRRTSDIGFQCRCNAVNTDAVIAVGDRNSVTANILGSSLSTGQPDCNEDGIVSVADRNLITSIILGGTGGSICNGAN